jgi:tetratricopeptide (TPR) repeat protein
MRDLGHTTRLAGSSQQAGWVEMLAGDWIQAESVFRNGYDVLGKLGEVGLEQENSFFLARALYELDRLDEVEELLLPAVVRDDPIEKCDWGSTFAKILARRGAIDEAETLARSASASAAATDQVRLQADVAFDLGEVLVMKGDLSEARALFSRSLRLYAEKGDLASTELRKRRLAELSV